MPHRWTVVFSRVGCPRHKGPSSIVVQASRPNDANSGHQILLSKTGLMQEAHIQNRAVEPINGKSDRHHRRAG